MSGTKRVVVLSNFEKFNPRKDVKNPSWFRFEHSFFEDPDFYDFTDGEVLAWLYLLTLASKKNSAEISISYAHAERVGRIRKAALDSSIEKLKRLGIIAEHVTDTIADVTPTLRARDVDVTDTNATRRDETGRNETRRDETPAEAEDLLKPKDLAALWNQHCGPLPKAERITQARIDKAKAQIRKYPDEKHWLDAITAFTSSDFCRNTWKPGFDDVLNETKRIRAIEGAYANKAAVNAPPNYAQRRQASNLALLEKIEAEWS